MSSSPCPFAAEPARAHDLEPALELLRRLDLPGLEVYESSGLLRSVAVEPAYRGQGLAAALYYGR